MPQRPLWRLLDSGATDGYTNMAIDEAMLLATQFTAAPSGWVGLLTRPFRRGEHPCALRLPPSVASKPPHFPPLAFVPHTRGKAAHTRRPPRTGQQGTTILMLTPFSLVWHGMS